MPRIHAKLNSYLAVYSKKLLLTFDSLKTAPVEISDSIKITTISDEILNKIANIGKIEIKKQLRKKITNTDIVMVPWNYEIKNSCQRREVDDHIMELFNKAHDVKIDLVNNQKGIKTRSKIASSKVCLITLHFLQTLKLRPK